jgi:hypothetical protein
MANYGTVVEVNQQINHYRKVINEGGVHGQVWDSNKWVLLLVF